MTFTILVLLLTLFSTNYCKDNQWNKEQKINYIDSLFKSVFESDKPGGSILVLNKGKVFYRNSIGLGNIEYNQKLSPNSIFSIGSLTKQFTSLCILLLEEQGKLSLSDNINKYLIDFPAHNNTITIEHLLTHTSGYIDYFDIPEFWGIYKNEISVQDALDLVKNEPLQFTPGKDYRYSGVNYILLGLIIEKITGNPFEKFLKTNIFNVLDMNDTYFLRKQKKLPNLAYGYTIVDDEFINADPVCMSFLFSAGAIYSNVDDLGKWINGLVNNRIIKKESLDRAWEKYILTNGDTINYGYGWDIMKLQGHTSLEHGGSMIGYDAYHIYLPDDSVYVVLLTNSISIQGPGRSKFSPKPIAHKIAVAMIK